MNRRIFINKVGVLGSGLFLFNNHSFGGAKFSYKRYVASSIAAPNLDFPDNKRVPLGWRVMPVAHNQQGIQPTVLRFEALKDYKNNSSIYFRLTTAIDFREEKHVKAFLPNSKVELGTFVMKFAHPFQPFEIEIGEQHISAILKEGIALYMTKGTGEGWFYSQDQDNNSNTGLQPHLLFGKSYNVEKVLFENLYSMNSFSPFGWMGGSVQDALYEFHLRGVKEASQTLKVHLESYLDDNKGIVFENPHTVPLDGTFNSIEDFLPFVAIQNLYPDHVSIEKALQFMMSKRNVEGLIVSGDHVTTEGCYTLAYPLAAIAKKRNDSALAQVAIDQLIHRKRYLTDDQAVYQRSSLNGNKSYRNWGRGVAWYLLGLIKTMKILEGAHFNNLEGKEEIYKSFLSAVEIVLSHQDRNGMWHSYIDDHQIGVDTSTTGGIAAAITWGCKSGVLQQHYLKSAQKAYESLLEYVSADGFLRHVSQINRGGEELQRSNYRVISQFGMGLMAQLKAALSADLSGNR